MTVSDLEDRLPSMLRTLAEEVETRPTAMARQGVRRRTQRLRRRRRIRTAVGGGLVASVVAATGLWLRDDGGGDTRTGPVADQPAPTTEPDATEPDPAPTDAELPPGDPDRRPAFIVDHPDLQPQSAEEHEGPLDQPDQGQQVFLRPGDYTGPVASVRHESSNDLGLPPDYPGVEAVDVNGIEAKVWTVGGLTSIQWDLGDGTGVWVDAQRLSVDEVTEFARGLRLQPDGLGFDATVRPQGITAIPLDPGESSTGAPQRQLDLASADFSSLLNIVVTGGDAAAFEALAAERVASASGEHVEELTVLGRPAVLAGDLAAEPHLMWRHTTTDIVEIVFAVSDRAELDAFIAGIREIPEGEWQELLATYS